LREKKTAKKCICSKAYIVIGKYLPSEQKKKWLNSPLEQVASSMRQEKINKMAKVRTYSIVTGNENKIRYIKFQCEA